MRLTTPVLLLLAAPLGAAGQAEPDTTAPWRYLPLQTGNVWEYAVYYGPIPGGPAPFVGYHRWVVTGDTVVGGRAYFALVEFDFDTDGAANGQSRSYVRFDTTAASVVSPQGWGGEWFFRHTPCELDGPFTDPDDPHCPTTATLRAGVGYGQPVLEVETSVKRFIGGLIGDTHELAADVGLVRYDQGEKGPPYRLEILYSRVGGMELGDRVVVLPPITNVEPGPAPAALTLRPNVARGQVHVVLPPSRECVLDAFDVWGRRVHREVVSAGAAAVALVVQGWAPGAYVVRASSGAWSAAAYLIVAR